MRSARASRRPAKPTVGKHAKVGPGVYEIVTSDDAVYVASAGGRGGTPPASIVVLDPATLDVKKSIAVTEAAYGLGINRKTQKIYTSNTRDGSVSVIDLKTGSVVASIKHGGRSAGARVPRAARRGHRYRLRLDRGQRRQALGD